ncbi:MAG TPA: hypothetical protein VEO54_00875 [Thermoanaerobaculia bacterium]|nr:hypothetical protein [Thermoanaerobaculia bacterium]
MSSTAEHRFALATDRRGEQPAEIRHVAHESLHRLQLDYGLLVTLLFPRAPRAPRDRLHQLVEVEGLADHREHSAWFDHLHRTRVRGGGDHHAAEERRRGRKQLLQRALAPGGREIQVAHDDAVLGPLQQLRHSGSVLDGARPKAGLFEDHRDQTAYRVIAVDHEDGLCSRSLLDHGRPQDRRSPTRRRSGNPPTCH